MALGTITEIERGVMGDLRYAILDVQPTTGANYTANGETLTAAQLGFVSEVLFSAQEPTTEVTSSSTYVYEIATGKLIAIDAATGVEEAAAQDLSTHKVRMFVIGR